MGNQCMGNPEEVLVEQVLKWIVPLEFEQDKASVSLTHAEVEDNEENPVEIHLREFTLNGIKLTGTLTADVPMLGEQELDVTVTASVTKKLGESGCDVQVTDFDVGGGMLSMLPIDTGALKQPVCDQISEVINEKIHAIGEDEEE
eukprot:gnl/TRDRNA2_/TRDRNA2_196362_c0_seq1.p1 gnl/TRDRNA2_/TRDRNA2_196362_c0~~gnl/TRDRNA2_/TRDRNA2_196362_c0_seq1.p1  ORF type:complete len:145 (-),score=39.74 gnl/TRDRNA2_/TRDRNA2_196362_c0_seq1:121-555(-)